MLLIMHILFAVSGIGLMLAALAGSLLKRASAQKFVPYSIFSTASTIVTGTILVIKAHAPLTPACLQGLMYIGVIGTLYTLTKRAIKVTITEK